MRAGPVIALSVPLGYYARNFLRSGVLEHLFRQHPSAQVAVLSPAWDDPAFREECARLGPVTCHPLHAYPTTLKLWERALWKARHAARRWRAGALALDRAIQWVYLRVRPRLYAGFFDAVQPDLVVTGSPGFHSNREIPLIREAQARKIKTLCVVFSWDNLASHALMPTRPDRLTVWNRYMKDEATAIHHYRADQVEIVGPPHFDLYQDRSIARSRQDYCRAMGLDPSKRIVLVAAGDNELLDNTFILDLLRAARAKGALPASEVQIVVRPHPMDVTGAFDRFKGDPQFTFDDQATRSPLIGWNPSREDMKRLADTLRHSDVVVNVASTIALEAAILDRPIVNVCFSPTQPQRFAEWVLDFHYTGHYRYVKEHQACRMASTAEELVTSIQAYLDRPETHQAQRRAMAEALCYRLDGRASQRVAEAILRACGPLAPAAVAAPAPMLTPARAAA